VSSSAVAGSYGGQEVVKAADLTRRGGKPCDTDSENAQTTPSESGRNVFCGAEVIPGLPPGLFRGPLAAHE